MTDAPTTDVVAIGNALVDVLTNADDAVLDDSSAWSRGRWTSSTPSGRRPSTPRWARAIEASGGSAANTIVGVASLGGRAAYIGRVRDDELGAVYVHDLRAAGVTFDVPPATDGLSTGVCLVLVTPDAERTMNTYLGASAELTADDVDADLVRERGASRTSRGTSGTRPPAQDAYRFASQVAHEAGRRVALDALGRLRGGAPPRHVPRADRGLGRRVVRQRHRDRDALRGRQLRRRGRRGPAPLLRRRAHPGCTGVGAARRRRRGRGGHRVGPGRARASTPPAPATSTPPVCCTGCSAGATSTPAAGSAGWRRRRSSRTSGPGRQTSLAALAAAAGL